MSAIKINTPREFVRDVFATLAVVVVLAPLFSVPRAFVGLKIRYRWPRPLRAPSSLDPLVIFVLMKPSFLCGFNKVGIYFECSLSASIRLPSASPMDRSSGRRSGWQEISLHLYINIVSTASYWFRAEKNRKRWQVELKSPHVRVAAMFTVFTRISAAA